MQTTLLDFNEMLAQMFEYGAKKMRSKNAEYQPAWISVEDRLPEHQGIVLVWEKKNGSVSQFWNGRANIACYYGGNWTPSSKIGEVTHWMELPNGPKDGDKNE